MVTGANGLLGHALIEKICNSYEVYAVVSGRHPVRFPSSVHVIKTNLLDIKQSESAIREIRPAILVHYAWDIQNADFEQSENQLIWMEVSLQLLRFFVANAGKRILFAGSASEYGVEHGSHENLCPVKLSLYGEVKLAFANIMSNYSFSNNVSFVDMRYFSVYGENDNRRYAAIQKTILSLLNNEAVVCKYPDNIWDYIYIQDAAEVTARLIESTYCGSVNICSGIPHRMEDVFKTIAKELNKEALLSFEYGNGCSRILVGNAAIMEQETNYKCMTPFEMGIRKTIEYMKSTLPPSLV